MFRPWFSTLGTTAHNHHLLALQHVAAVRELFALHETTLAQLGQLLTQVQVLK
ncbi:hypothetical protein ACLK12_20140 [Escherichia coli]